MQTPMHTHTGTHALQLGNVGQSLVFLLFCLVNRQLFALSGSQIHKNNVLSRSVEPTGQGNVKALNQIK